MRIAIVGSGKLAKALLDKLSEIDSDIIAEPWDSITNSTEKTDVVIHAGSGRQWQSALAFCEKASIPLIQAATPEDQTFSENPTFVCIKAPNLSLPIVKFTHLLKQMRTLFAQAEKELVESHQAKKTTLAGSAKDMARFVGLDESRIQNVRDPDVQKELGIPKEHLHHHSLHVLSLEEDAASLTFCTNVYGALTYVIGAAKIARASLDLSPGIYDVMDVIEKSALLGQSALT